MKSTNPSSRSLWAWLLVASLSLLLAGPAQAFQTSGKGILEAKDSDALTLFVDEIVIQVNDDTRIFDESDRRISFAQIPEPRQMQTAIEYTGRRSPQGLVATRLVVRPMPR